MKNNTESGSSSKPFLHYSLSLPDPELLKPADLRACPNFLPKSKNFSREKAKKEEERERESESETYLNRRESDGIIALFSQPAEECGVTLSTLVVHAGVEGRREEVVRDRYGVDVAGQVLWDRAHIECARAGEKGAGERERSSGLR